MNLPTRGRVMIGEKLGRYTIIEDLGSGSMGTVYKAEDPAMGRLVAIKLVRSNVLYDSHKRERFLQGLLAASEIRHKSLCPILEIGDEDDDFFIVTPFIRGETLAYRMGTKSLSWMETLDIIVAVGEALAAVHAAGAVHRSLKPSNIWIQNDGTVLLTDCCVARFTEIERGEKHLCQSPKSDLADTIIPMRALGYMSPEQVQGASIDSRSDIFSLAALIYEILSGRHPFEARNSLSRMSAILEADPVHLSSKKQMLPQELDGVVRKALARKPQDRYQRIEQFVAALRSVLEKQQTMAHRPSGTNVGAQLGFMYTMRLIIVGILLITITFCIFYFFRK